MADTVRGRAFIDVDLVQVDAPAAWDGALQGSSGGLSVTVMLRRLERGGELRGHWSYSYSIDVDIREQVRALAVVDAMHGVGTLTIEDRRGVRPPVTQQLPGREMERDFPFLKRFLEGLVAIEDWTGHMFSLPEVTPAAEVKAVLDIAEIIRAGQSRMDFDEIELVIPVKEYEHVFKGPGRFALAQTFGVAVLGDEVLIGELVGELTDVDIEAKSIVEDGEEKVRLLLRPGSDGARHPTFTLRKLDSQQI